jgi:hypothetical protein
MAERPLSDEERQAIARAEAVIAGLAGQYRAVAEADLARLKAAAASLATDPAGRTSHLDRLFQISHDMKGQGATFGYPLVTAIGNRLCRFIEKHREILDDAGVAVVLRHVEALDRVIGQRMKEPATPEAEALIESLERSATEVGE